MGLRYSPECVNGRVAFLALKSSEGRSFHATPVFGPAMHKDFVLRTPLRKGWE